MRGIKRTSASSSDHIIVRSPRETRPTRSSLPFLLLRITSPLTSTSSFSSLSSSSFVHLFAWLPVFSFVFVFFRDFFFIVFFLLVLDSPFPLFSIGLFWDATSCCVPFIVSHSELRCSFHNIPLTTFNLLNCSWVFIPRVLGINGTACRGTSFIGRANLRGGPFESCFSAGVGIGTKVPSNEVIRLFTCRRN